MSRKRPEKCHLEPDWAPGRASHTWQLVAVLVFLYVFVPTFARPPYMAGQGSKVAVAQLGPPAMPSTGDRDLLDAAVSNILDFYFKPSPGRKIVIVCDRDKLSLSEALLKDLERRRCPGRLMVIGDDLESFTEPLEELFENDQVGLMVLASPRMWRGLRLNQRLEHRNRLPSIRSKCSPVFFDAVTPLPNLLRLYSADPEENHRFLAHLQERLANNSLVRIVAPGGTDIQFKSRRWEIWGWEVLTCPVEHSVNGTIVADAGVFFSRVQSPIKLRIRAGKLVSVECADQQDKVFERYVKWMEEARESGRVNWQLAEVGIGGNANAQVTDVLMESEVVRGTCHFCFGDNSTFGGPHKTSWHGGTVVVHQPRVEAGGTVVRPGAD